MRLTTLQNRCRTRFVVRPLGSVIVARSTPLNWIVTGATLDESRVLGFHGPVSVCPLPKLHQLPEKERALSVPPSGPVVRYQTELPASSYM